MNSRPFKKFFWWFIGMLLICFIGINNVFAEETKTGLGYLNNSTVIISNDKGVDINLSRNTANSVNMDINTIIFQSNYAFQKNVVYEYEVELANQYLNNINSVRITSGNNICSFISLQGMNSSYLKIRFSCPNSVNYLTIGLNNLGGNTITNSYNIRWNSIYLWSITDTINLGPIINNDNANTQNIINNNNNNTQSIIDNNNQNTQDIIDSNKVCSHIDKNDIITDNYFLNIVGNIYSSNVYGITDYINVYNSSLKVLSNFTSQSSGSTCFYDVNKTLISCTRNDLLGVNTDITLPNNTYYLRASIQKIQNLPSFELCKSGNQALDETNKGIFSKIKELFSWFTNDDDADISGLNNMVGWLPPGPVDSIINLPLAFFNALTNTLSGTCQDVSLTLPFVNQTLVLPCFDSYMTQYLQHFSTFWTLVGSIVSIFILYNYLLSLYKWVDDTLTFRENNLPGYYGDNWGGGA